MLISMGEERQLTLVEYETLEGIDLTPQSAAALAGSKALTVSPRPHDGWSIKAKNYVGTVTADGVEVIIRPKLPIARFFFMLAYTLDERSWREVVASFEEADDLVSAIAHALAHHSEHALRQGTLQGYKTIEESTVALRGRLRAADQARRHFGQPLPLEITYDDFTEDIAENQLIRSAARSLLHHRDLSTTLRGRLIRISKRLDTVTYINPGEQLPFVRIDRRNRRYGPALRLSELVLSSRSVAYAPGSITATGFLIDMNRLFESFVTQALAEAATSSVIVRSQHRTHLDISQNIKLRPDITWWAQNELRAVGDIKYKSLADKDLPNADVYQALAYAIGLNLPTAHLIYGEGNEVGAVHEIRHSGHSVLVHAINLDQHPEALLAELAHLGQSIVEESGVSELATLSA